MSLDFQQIQAQVRQFGEGAAEREQKRQNLREQAMALLQADSQDLAKLREKIKRAAQQYDVSLRCALPLKEGLDAHLPLPAAPAQATLLAADGSQINPDRHAEVDYCVINVGAIMMRISSSEAPLTVIRSRLKYADDLLTPSGVITEGSVALERDVEERKLLAELAVDADAPIFTLTDGPIELWGGKDSGEQGQDYAEKLQEYLQAFSRLQSLGVCSAGYVDKPGANLVVRALEICSADEAQLANIREHRPFRMVTDKDLYTHLLQPGERSAVFGMQSQSAKHYRGPLGIHFFYLNVGRPEKPWLARVEIPAWVVGDQGMLDHLHAILIQQCQVMGSRSFPYLLHRAHEVAVVKMEEKDQVTLMLVNELIQRGIMIGEISHKQSAKNLQSRTAYQR